jgi:phospho-N-acetylmuramoyl-pentapeptide-transferase
MTNDHNYNSMESKLLAQKFNPSGMTLLIFITAGLSLTSLIFDWQTNHIFTTQSLTLPLWISALITAGLGHIVIPILQRLKAGQFIREDGPQTHLKKAGTPTMGGIFIVPTGVILSMLLSGFNPNVIAVALLTFAYGFIGWLDDWLILRYKSNKGISPKMKLGLQVGFGLLFCLWLFFTKPNITNLALPLGIVIPLGALFWLLAIFVLLAESNATNLTDGVDGLAGGTGAIALLGLGMIVAPKNPELMTCCACISGSYFGFLVHNRNPAKVFMGDTGSLALGGALGGVGLLTNNLFPLLIISGIFLIESLSVIAQVSYYKATKGPDGKGKRLFKMAPFHHHLELSGWKETQVVGTFYIVNAVLCFIAILFR